MAKQANNITALELEMQQIFNDLSGASSPVVVQPAVDFGHVATVEQRFATNDPALDKVDPFAQAKQDAEAKYDAIEADAMALYETGGGEEVSWTQTPAPLENTDAIVPTVLSPEPIIAQPISTDNNVEAEDTGISDIRIHGDIIFLGNPDSVLSISCKICEFDFGCCCSDIDHIIKRTIHTYNLIFSGCLGSRGRCCPFEINTVWCDGCCFDIGWFTRWLCKDETLLLFLYIHISVSGQISPGETPPALSEI